jgi:DNA-binding NtrC family response regulator
VTHGRFREDLFYRLHGFPITVPPLAERPEDIPDLVRHFLARFCAEEGKRIRAVAPEAVALLRTYPWPGNVRQLENAVFRAVVLAETDQIGVNEFPQIQAHVASCRDLQDKAPHLGPDDHLLPAIASEQLGLGTLLADGQSLAPPLAATEPGHPNTAPGMLDLLDPQGHVRPLEDIENEAIRFAITHCRGQMSEVARKLRIGRSTLYRKLKDLGFETGPEPDQGEHVASR